MSRAWGGEIAAEDLLREGLTSMFGPAGGHLQCLQEADAAPVLSSTTKWTKRVHNREQISYGIRKALRDAMTPPCGPVALELPLDVFNWEPTERDDQVSFLAGDWRLDGPPVLPPDPAKLANVVELLKTAHRPLMIAGDGVHWDHARGALRAVAERPAIPVSLRRLARGAVSEKSDVVLLSSIRKPFIGDADVVVLLGQEVGYFESCAPPGCYVENVDESEQLRDVIERALASGKTSVINAMGSRDVFHPLYAIDYSNEMFSHLPAPEIEAPARERHIDYHYPKFHDGVAPDVVEP